MNSQWNLPAMGVLCFYWISTYCTCLSYRLASVLWGRLHQYNGHFYFKYFYVGVLVQLICKTHISFQLWVNKEQSRFIFIFFSLIFYCSLSAFLQRLGCFFAYRTISAFTPTCLQNRIHSSPVVLIPELDPGTPCAHAVLHMPQISKSICAIFMSICNYNK